MGFYYKVNDKEFPAFIYYVNFSSGDQNAIRYRYTIIELPIEQTSLNFYLNSKVNKHGARYAPERPKSKKFKLEGDFGQFYDLSFADNQHIEALSIFEPNLMLAILENFGNVDIELKANKLYIIMAGFKSAESLMKALNNSKILTDQINHTIKSTRSGDRHDAKLKDDYKHFNKKVEVNTALIYLVVYGSMAAIFLPLIIDDEEGGIFTIIAIFSLIGISLVVAIIFFIKSKDISAEYIKKYGKNGIY